MVNKKQKRLRRLELLVPQDKAFCINHQTPITFEMLYQKKCYTGNHGKNYCKYLEINDGR